MTAPGIDLIARRRQRAAAQAALSRERRAVSIVNTRSRKGERGYPEVMCATEKALTEQRALCGPTGRMEAIGPVGRGTLNAHAYDKAVMEKSWEVSEDATGFVWRL